MNQDGLLSLHELECIKASCSSKLWRSHLRASNNLFALQGIMLGLSPEHTSSNTNIDNSNAKQLIVLGRFASRGQGPSTQFIVDLFGS
ncbi:MAG: hypothetical protein IPI79_15510 [Moraxellaceae bacterium]|nr:hypothetical protein [Moraxellaceae bacterium]